MFMKWSHCSKRSCCPWIARHPCWCYVLFLLSVCQCSGQGWREVHDPRRLCPEVSRTTNADPPQPKNCTAHCCCGWHHKGRVRTANTHTHTLAHSSSSLIDSLLSHVWSVLAIIDKPPNDSHFPDCLYVQSYVHTLHMHSTDHVT